MKLQRVVSFVLTLVLLFSAAALCVQPAAAASEMTVSEDLIKILKLEEGFIRYPSWDYAQYSIGYGTRCPSDMLSYYKENGITEEEADLLLRNYLAVTEQTINTYLIDAYNLELNQGQFDAIVSFSYNMGTGWITNGQNILQTIISDSSDNDVIDAFSRWCSAGGAVQDFLIRRRLSEANMYLNGEYSRTAPSNYCYVIYDANGGTRSQSVQGYDSKQDAEPKAVAVYNGYTFTGWYTAQVGGKKVESLKAKHSGMTLYAHWAELESVTPEEGADTIKVTVTTNGVNLRKGPGTNYAIIGIADTGKTFDIIQVAENGGYTWGQYEGGWICLQYTDYESVTQEETEPTEPETTEPTEPETTKKPTEAKATEPTEPETTKKPTEAKTTEATEPETTKPTENTAVTGTVTANPYLCVRQGAGTGYATVDTLQKGEKVTITEQKTVGSMIWGKISNGWISLSYVKLNEDTAEESGKDTTTGQTGTVTCAVLNVRSGAGVTYGIVGTYGKNTKITVTKTKTVGSTTWGKTSKGWVSMDYVKLTESSSSNSGTDQETTTGNTNSGSSSSTTQTGKVISQDVLRIRAGAGTSYAITGFLNPGATVEITKTKTVGSTTWGKTSKGWVSLDYVQLDGAAEEETDKTTASGESKTVNVSCLCVRSGAGTSNSIVSYLYKGAKVTVTETKSVGSTTWGKISSGWICLDYTK